MGWLNKLVGIIPPLCRNPVIPFEAQKEQGMLQCALFYQHY